MVMANIFSLFVDNVVTLCRYICGYADNIFELFSVFITFVLKILNLCSNFVTIYGDYIILF